ncbi:alpha/beta hydrolase [Herbaspirillum sp. WKF16]|jgi:predicted alpha/beta hydrolase family esterase|uniref:RBBP9/YdeN family alpha/beta hydrolase n=1 Tax=Herbaspirillum sp. WKF16 TaxID=3028312 RepID=UPI0023A9F000|nr:alpha/beta hydrolase [Herbaspirillum sp. WKF16]WDZ94761.1 alpha/beta hydrolase [Herbaspirillum sp. WKF16]
MNRSSLHPAAAAPPSRLADYRVLVAPGLHGSGPEHWQSRWQRLYPAFERVEQEEWGQAELPRWSSRLGEMLAQDSRPTVIVAHSFGCLTTVHRAAALQAETGAGSPIVAALLVAPADPDKFGVAAEVSHRLPFAALVVGSEDDPWMSAPRARHWAEAWGAGFTSAGALGHINADSGLGDWTAGQRLLLGLLERAAASPALP